jgi:type IV secretory pathway VirB3-like protein
MSGEAHENEHVCFLSCTRPVMFHGVTMEGFMLNVAATVIAFVQSSSLKFLLVGVVIHFLFRMLLWEDHNRFRLLFLKIATTGKCLNKTYWGGSSTSPLGQKKTYTRGDFANV